MRCLGRTVVWVIVVLGVSAISGCGVDNGMEDTPPQVSADSDPGGDSDAVLDTLHSDDEEVDYHFGWDTGTGAKMCMGIFMTVDDCLAASGTIDISLWEFRCVDGQEQQCCLLDSLTNPCPHECMHAAECQQREGKLVPVDLGYECAYYSDRCCEDPLPKPHDTDQFWAPPFDPADCPVVTPVTALDQPDNEASGICMELMDENSEWFCPQDTYDRIVRDMNAIKAAYPAIADDRGGQQYDGFGDAKLPFTILCVPGVNLEICTDFPRGAWEDLLQCFGADHEHCLFKGDDDTTCGQAHLWWTFGVNTKRMMSYFEDHAKSLVPGSVCELNAYFGLSYPLNGFHLTDYGNGIWVWDVRSTGKFDFGTAHCDFRITLSTLEASADLSVLEVEDLSDAQCDIPAFL